MEGRANELACCFDRCFSDARSSRLQVVCHSSLIDRYSCWSWSILETPSIVECWIRF